MFGKSTKREEERVGETKMKTLLLAMCLAFTLLGCLEKPSEGGVVALVNNFADRVIYFKEKKSGICFATISYNPPFFYDILTAVPCEKVENLLVNK